MRQVWFCALRIFPLLPTRSEIGSKKFYRFFTKIRFDWCCHVLVRATQQCCCSSTCSDANSRYTLRIVMARKYPNVLSVGLTVFILLALAACGGGSSSSSNGSNGDGGGSNTPPPVIAVSISPTTATLNTGGTQQFQATVTGTTNTAVQWEVNAVVGGNAQTGTISTTGLYTAPATLPLPTNFTVSAVSVADGTKSASATVTVNSPVQVMISPTSAAIAVNATQQFTATVSGTSNTAVTWSVDGVAGGNSTVGTVSAAGLYTAPAMFGSHMVTATSVADATQSASATVAVVSLNVTPSTATLSPHGTQQFTANVQGYSDNSVTWSVDGVMGGNSTVGTISTTGFYTAPGSLGQHTITATSVPVPNLSANATVTVVNAPPGSTAVLTYHNDDLRDGVNANETALNLSNVNMHQFGKKYVFPVDGQMYAQPLYVPNLMIDGTQHNVVFAATENDTVYAFDANGLSNTPLWKKHLGTPPANNDSEGISPILGITATPVIDSTTGTMYVLTDTQESHRTFRLHALDITTGNEKFGGPVIVTGTVPGTGWDSNNGMITLESSCYQRTALALNPVTNAIYIGFGHCSHGWLLAYDKATLQQTAILNTTPDGAGGALWAGGGTAAIDDTNGDLFIISGVDLGDPAPDYNDSALRLKASDLSILDYFKPANEAYLRSNDADFGSGTGIIMPDNGSSTPHEYIGGGKDGRIFVMDRDNMGQYQNSDHVIQVVQTGVHQFDNIFDTPTFWNGLLYYHCEDDVIRAWSWDADTGLLSNDPVAKGTVTYGQHGATSSLSANGTSDGIVWEVETTNYGSGPAVLHAYNATNVHTELYNSSQAGGRDKAGTAVKFTVPTIADGHVFVGTSTELDIYGLLSQP